MAALFAPIILFTVATPVQADPPAPPWQEKDPPRPGVVFVLDGIGGHDWLGMTSQLFLPRAGVKHTIRPYNWSHGFGQLLKDLQDTRHMGRKAEELAALILAEKEADADRPIYILANSGGTGLALLAAERLPAGTLERIVLMQAAVSPDYDMRCALRAVRSNIVNHHSSMDRIILHWGTWQFGTADRHYVASAGCTGFVVPKNMTEADAQLYQRLLQIPWEPRMMLDGHHGGHLGVHAPLFLINHVAPWLRD
jgi:hypothetical protein